VNFWKIVLKALRLLNPRLATSLAERGRKILRAQLRILLAGLTELAQRYHIHRRIECSLMYVAARLCCRTASPP
jgi:hypothetical protein